jgi:thiaminase/transcriptional activator TenA
MNRLGEGLPEAKKQHLIDIFVTSSRYEYLFWEMAETQEQWPV